MKEKIENQIDETAKVRTEPRVLGDHGALNSNGKTADRTLGFQLRAKTVDLFVDLSMSRSVFLTMSRKWHHAC